MLKILPHCFTETFCDSCIDGCSCATSESHNQKYDECDCDARYSSDGHILDVRDQISSCDSGGEICSVRKRREFVPKISATNNRACNPSFF